MDNGYVKLRASEINAPEAIGSYNTDDCVFLLKNINGLVYEQESSLRESAVQRGIHYSAALPSEYMPESEYIKLFLNVLNENAKTTAVYAATVAEKILAQKEQSVVLVSLARAGSPFGALIKRYVKQKYGIALPHYSVSIIRDMGLDENALAYIVNKHSSNLQFIDGWTGKGTIALTLADSCKLFGIKSGVYLDSGLAVLSDPGCCAAIFGTREDYPVPHACLNTTISGLISRTYYRSDIIGENDFHGVKYYHELNNFDYTNFYLDKISSCFPDIKPDMTNVNTDYDMTFSGMKQCDKIMSVFGITDPNLVKPGIGEATRVLTRHVPGKILIKDGRQKNLGHILFLADKFGASVEIYNDMNYACCGIIKDMVREG